MPDSPSSYLSLSLSTIPDIKGLRLVYSLPADLSDSEVAEYAFQRQRIASGRTALPVHLTKIVSMSLVLKDEFGTRLEVMAFPRLDEQGILSLFGEIVGAFDGALYCWGRGVSALLKCRAVLHELVMPFLFAKESPNAGLIDLRELLVDGAQGNATLPAYFSALGASSNFKPIEGEDVWQAFLAGDVVAGNRISNQMALMSHFVLLRYLHTSGQISPADYHSQLHTLQNLLL